MPDKVSDNGSETDIRMGDPTQRSNERTDGRTDAADTYDRNSGSRSERVRAYSEIDGIVALGDVIEAGELWATDRRHEVIRTGERDPIPSFVRAAVWYRDQGKCDECLPEYPSGDILHLDHIKPWSAGGSDTTDNLRLLCERHNLSRSNFIDYARPKRPATWWCSNCYVLDEHRWDYLPPWIVDCPRHGANWTPEKPRCRVARAFGAAYMRGDEVPTWHQRPLFEVERLTRIAYCAHCAAPGLTGYPL